MPGQTYQISQYEALYSLLGTLYGGTPSQNFKLPNLTGRMPIGTGPAQPTYNLPAYNPGQFGGTRTWRFPWPTCRRTPTPLPPWR